MSQDKLFREIDKLLITQDDIDSYEGKGEDSQVKCPSYWRQSLIDSFDPEEANAGAVLPWSKTHAKVQLREGEVSLWCGYNGHKKSMITTQVALDLIAQGQKGCIASFEMKPELTLKRMACMAFGHAEPTDILIDKLLNWLDGNLFIFDHTGVVPTDRILKLIRYCGEHMGLDFMFIDSLMKCGMPTDDYNAQKNFVAELDSIASDTGMHVHLIAHMRKPPKDHRYIPDRYDIAGGSDVSNQAANIFICWADRQKADELNKPINYQDQEIIDMPDEIFVVEKQRNGDFEGRFSMWFDTKSLQMKGSQGIRPKPYRDYYWT